MRPFQRSEFGQCIYPLATGTRMARTRQRASALLRLWLAEQLPVHRAARPAFEEHGRMHARRAAWRPASSTPSIRPCSSCPLPARDAVCLAGVGDDQAIARHGADEMVELGFDRGKIGKISAWSNSRLFEYRRARQ